MKSVFFYLYIDKIYEMNFQQLEYILAVDKHRHFAKAAKQCFVTQPTLSLMIQKLEDEFGVKIFNRDVKPVEPTKEGIEIISRSRELLAKTNLLKAYAAELKGENKGELHLGIIPTLAPYLLPLFLKSFTEKFPHLRIYIKEMLTNDIIDKLKKGDLDIGLLATPLMEPQLSEQPLFYEDFYAYVSAKNKFPAKKLLLPREIELDKLWLLEEGHCFRNQVFNFCELKKQDKRSDNLHYEAGSIETLINLVDKNQGITIIPHLATLLLKPSQTEKLHKFADKVPVREISMVTINDFPRKKLFDNLKASILNSIPDSLLQKEKKNVTEINLL